MFGQGFRLSKSLRTQSAGKGFLPGVSYCVTGQVDRLSKSLRTQSTGKRFLLSVSSCVTGQVAGFGKHFTTGSTLVLHGGQRSLSYWRMKDR